MGIHSLPLHADTDLHAVIKKGNLLKDVHKRYIMYQLLKATKYLHSGNVIHRDQKVRMALQPSVKPNGISTGSQYAPADWLPVHCVAAIIHIKFLYMLKRQYAIICLVVNWYCYHLQMNCHGEWSYEGHCAVCTMQVYGLGWTSPTISPKSTCTFISAPCCCFKVLHKNGEISRL